MLICILLFALLPLVLSQNVFPAPLAYYANEKVLQAGAIRLSWNYTETSLIGELHAKTQGWVGFGISPTGGMNGADVFIAKIVDGSVNFTDRHIVGTEIRVDKHADWRLLKSQIVNGFLIVQFTREIDTCDSNDEDLKIETGTPRVIFAWKDTLSNGDVDYHGNENRGTIAVELINAPNQKLILTPDDKIETYDFTVDVTIPSIETYYHCHMFKLPDKLITDKRHLLRYKTNITPGNEKNVHHWVTYQCTPGFEDYLNKNKPNDAFPKPGNCFDGENTYSANPLNTWNNLRQYCMQTTFVWAIGGDLIADFPNDLGFPVGGADREFTYFFLEMHYDNPLKKSGIVDRTSVQWSVTPILRKTEIGIFMNGANSDWSGIIIPPGEIEHKLRYYCGSNCLDTLTKENDITVFAAAPHTHVTGVGIQTTLIRNGAEVAYITKNRNYDFNYQVLNYLQEPIKLKKGDAIETTCTYKTLSKTTYTFGGIGTPEEMCLDYIFYYPRKPYIGSCISLPDGWDAFTRKLYQSGAMTMSVDPPNGNSIRQDLKTLKTDYDTKKLIKDFFENSDQAQYCLANGGMESSTNKRVNPVKLVETSECEPPIMNSASKARISQYSLIGLIMLWLLK